MRALPTIGSIAGALAYGYIGLAQGDIIDAVLYAVIGAFTLGLVVMFVQVAMTIRCERSTESLS